MCVGVRACMCMCVFEGGCRWIRIPAIIYGSHVATTLIPILYHFIAADAMSQLTVTERLYLCAVYAPYLIIPLMLVYHMLTSPDYLPTNQLSFRLKQH